MYLAGKSLTGVQLQEIREVQRYLSSELIETGMPEDRVYLTFLRQVIYEAIQVRVSSQLLRQLLDEEMGFGTIRGQNGLMLDMVKLRSEAESKTISIKVSSSMYSHLEGFAKSRGFDSVEKYFLHQVHSEIKRQKTSSAISIKDLFSTAHILRHRIYHQLHNSPELFDLLVEVTGDEEHFVYPQKLQRVFELTEPFNLKLSAQKLSNFLLNNGLVKPEAVNESDFKSPFVGARLKDESCVAFLSRLEELIKESIR